MNLMKKKRHGYLLINSALAIIVLYMVSIGLFTIFSGQFSMAQAGQTALQAQQYAEIAANTLQLHNYEQLDAAAHGRQTVADTAGAWEDEITIGPEKNINDNKQRIATVKIYKNGDTLSRYSLQVPLSSQGSNSGVPIGTVIAWPIITDPNGSDTNKWLECNGQTINPGLYPKLAALMSNTPDYRGLFLRGYGSQYSYHYNVVLHQSANLGELQGDSIRNIIGSFGQHVTAAANGVFYRGHTATEAVKYADPSNNSVNFDTSRVVPVANENRPLNRAVRYLIRAA